MISTTATAGGLDPLITDLDDTILKLDIIGAACQSNLTLLTHGEVHIADRVITARRCLLVNRVGLTCLQLRTEVMRLTRLRNPLRNHCACGILNLNLRTIQLTRTGTLELVDLEID